jgi:hypothetical protein
MNAHDFTKRLHGLLAREHGALAEFLLELSDLDERRLWLELGYASRFDFLHRELRLSKGAAFHRKTAVALVQQFPGVADALRDGKLCVMTVAELARVLNPGNRAEVLPRFFGLSKREAQALAATLLPREAPPLRELVTPVRPPPAALAHALSLAAPAPVENPVQPVEPRAPPPAAAQPVCGPAPFVRRRSRPPPPSSRSRPS